MSRIQDTAGPAGIWSKGRTGRLELPVVEVIGGRSWGWERSRRVCKDLEAIYQVDACRDMLQRTQNYPWSKKVTLLFQREIEVTGKPPSHVQLLQGLRLHCRECNQD